jgi:hypothetical protein
VGTNYYVRTNECDNACEHCEGELLHLGKFSAGWAFSFRGEPEWFEDINKNPFSLWYCRVKKGAVETEHGTPIRTDDFLADVLHSYSVLGNKRHADHYPGEHSRKVGQFSFTITDFS